VGLKFQHALDEPARRGRFRRTLVGLKSVIDGKALPNYVSFRRTLVGLKFPDRGRGRRRDLVSDVPSWG